jgi:solute:Na+ symporter, SSS family
VKTWLLVFGAAYAALLVYASVKSYRKGRTAEEFMLAGSNIGMMLGVLTYAAALFSTFTFLGMPDLFRTHGIGAWVFLGVSDGAMVFFILWFGYHIRRRVRQYGFRGVAGLIGRCYDSPRMGYLIFASSFIFLIPYVSIQIQGIGIFLNAAFPGALPSWAWSAGIVAIMLLYSEIGGLKAIIFSDAIQGLLLLGVIWLIAGYCIAHFGGIGPMFASIQEINPELLSTPGPKGLFTVQFFIASMVAILMIPVTQPQLTTRLVVMKNLKSLHRMAVAVGVFAILVILPTSFIGMYGADLYRNAGMDEFFSRTFLFDRPGFAGALALIGLIAAGLSTTNAQIFALGSELRGLMAGDEASVMRRTKLAIFFFAIIALVFSELIRDQIALLARESFAGTALMGPMILLGVLSNRKVSHAILYLSGAALLLFLFSKTGYVPQMVAGIRMDLLLFVLLSLAALISHLLGRPGEAPAGSGR